MLLGTTKSPQTTNLVEKKWRYWRLQTGPMTEKAMWFNMFNMFNTFNQRYAPSSRKSRVAKATMLHHVVSPFHPWFIKVYVFFHGISHLMAIK
jgi:hypothetical protein